MFFQQIKEQNRKREELRTLLEECALFGLDETKTKRLVYAYGYDDFSVSLLSDSWEELCYFLQIETYEFEKIWFIKWTC